MESPKKMTDIIQKFSSELPAEPSPFLHVLIIAGTFEQPIKKAQIKIYRSAFYGQAGWELKDCVAMGLPQHLRFELVRECKRVVVYGIEGYILRI